jgi:Kef-type K+ transport system membrane component KefB
LRSGISPLAVGVGMVPRGEVELIFATVGSGLRLHGRPVVPPAMFGAVVVTVVATSVLPPPVLARLLRAGGTGR